MTSAILDFLVVLVFFLLPQSTKSRTKHSAATNRRPQHNGSTTGPKNTIPNRVGDTSAAELTTSHRCAAPRTKELRFAARYAVAHRRAAPRTKELRFAARYAVAARYAAPRRAKDQGAPLRRATDGGTRPRLRACVDDDRIGERRPDRFCTANFCQNW